MSNNFIENTKKFFDKKPVRIVVAIIVIVAIMTAVGYGIYELYLLLSDPCAHEPGKRWSDELKTCVLENCAGDMPVCEVKGTKWTGQCPPKDYCGDKYVYDPDTCQCKLNCPSGYETWTRDGKQSSDINEDGQPENPLYCGKKCEFSTNINQGSSGGKGWCAEKYLCAIDISKDGRVENDNCLDSDDYRMCSGTNKGRPVACATTCKRDGDDMDSYYCEFEKCGLKDGLKDGKKVVCRTDSDCHDGTSTHTSKYTCNFEHDIILDKKLNLGFDKKIGICNDNHISSINSFCVDPKNIGRNIYGDIVECSGEEEGINASIGQCKQNLTDGTLMETRKGETNYDALACATNGICNNNKWQALTKGDTTEQSLCANSDNVNVPKECTESDKNRTNCFIEDGKCCEPGHQAYNPITGDNFCCAIKMEGKGNTNCLNTTRNGYSWAMLDNQGEHRDINEIITMKKGPKSSFKDEQTQITEYNKLLYKQLGLTGDEISEAKDPNNINYATVYFDKESNSENPPLKAFCGQFNGEDSGSNVYVVTNLLDNSSWCNKKNNCKVSNIIYTNNSDNDDTFNGIIPICRANLTGANADEDKYYWGTDSKETDFSIYGNVYPDKQLDPEGKQVCNTKNLIADCSNIAAITSGVKTMNIINQSEKEDNQYCQFEIDCKDIDTSVVKDGGVVAWNDLITDLKNNQINLDKGQQPSNGNHYLQESIATTYPFKPQDKCKGKTNGFQPEATVSPKYFNGADCFTYDSKFKSKLLHTGEYCQNGVNMYNTEECNKE
jgi:hypothetical protein